MKLRISRRAFATAATALPLVKPAFAKQTQEAVYAPHVVDLHGFNTIVAVAETIIPRTDTGGAGEAKVAEHLDALLEASPLAERQEFLEGLWAFDAFCRSQRVGNLQDVVAKALGDDAHPQHSFVLQAKNLIARIYYATEIGQGELNKGNRVPATYF